MSKSAAIALDATHVYWAPGNGTGIYGAVIPNQPSAQIQGSQFVSGQGQIYSIAAGNGWLYWAAPANGGTIQMASVSPDGGIGVTQQLAVGQPNPYAVAVDFDAGYIYWTTLGFPPDYDGGVMRALLDGGEVTLIASGQAFPQTLAINETSVFWVDADAGAIWEATPRY